MINEDLRIIKDKYGEKMMHLCRDLFPLLLEKPGLLSKTLLDNFEPNRFLYDDLDVYGKTVEFKNYMYSRANQQVKATVTTAKKIPEQLLQEAGYILYECKTEEEIQRFKKYYKANESLCTFTGRRLERCYVFFAVAKDVDSIKREDFPIPERQDSYGTSVISIQFTKDKSHTLSIKNRYNHTVSNPDATFSNNLDNIIEGLTKSFEDHYEMKQSFKNEFELIGYVKANDGKYYKYNLENNGIYYCPNNIIIDNFAVKRVSKEQYLLIDNFMLNLIDRKIQVYDTKDSEDDFISFENRIERITISNTANGKKITLASKNKSDSIIELNHQGQIIGLTNYNLIKVGNNFLAKNKALTQLECEYLAQVGNDFLVKNTALTQLECPNLVQVGDNFLLENKALTKLECPNLIKTGDYFLNWYDGLSQICFPNLIQVRNGFLGCNKSLIYFECPNLIQVGNGFINANEIMTQLKCPKLTQVGYDFLYNNTELVQLEFPNLTHVNSGFLNNNTKLSHLDCPKLTDIGILPLINNPHLAETITNNANGRSR